MSRDKANGEHRTMDGDYQRPRTQVVSWRLAASGQVLAIRLKLSIKTLITHSSLVKLLQNQGKEISNANFVKQIKNKLAEAMDSNDVARLIFVYQ